LARKGELITHHKDQAVLRLMNVKKVIDNDLKTIQPGKTLGDLIKLIEISKRNIFPVVDDDDNYYGVVVMDDIRKDMFHEEKWNNPIENYIIQAPAHVSTDESMESVMNKLKQTGNYNLPVVDNGKYIGFVSRANIFSAYRKTLIDVTYD
jgi:CIC family chloride channel protein